MVGSQFDINFEFFHQHHLHVRDNGNLKVEDVTVPESKHMMRWDYRDNATVSFDGFRATEGDWGPKISHDYCNPIWQNTSDNVQYRASNADVGLTPMSQIKSDGSTMDASVSIDNSNVDLELIYAAGNYTLSLPDKNTHVSDWSFDSGVSINVSNSTLGNIDFGITPGAHITLHDSNNARFGWGMGWRRDIEGNNPKATISGLIGDGTHYANETWSNGSSSLTVINSTIDTWWPNVHGNFDLTIKGANLMDPEVHDDASVRFEDVNLWRLHVSDKASTQLVDSRVRTGDLLAEGSGRLEIIDTEVQRGFKGIEARGDAAVVINGVTHTAADGRFADLSGMYERDSYVSVETAIAIGARSGLDDFALDSVLETGSTTVSEVFSHDNDADAGSKATQQFKSSLRLWQVLVAVTRIRKILQ